jgi:hypothetical protein
MQDQDRPDRQAEFSNTEGLALALSYMHDPASVPCPCCGPGMIEVVAYLDADRMEEGVMRTAAPEGEYTVVLFCHACRRAGALNLRPDDRGGIARSPSEDDLAGGEDTPRAA